MLVRKMALPSLSAFCVPQCCLQNRLFTAEDSVIFQTDSGVGGVGGRSCASEKAVVTGLDGFKSLLSWAHLQESSCGAETPRHPDHHCPSFEGLSETK